MINPNCYILKHNLETYFVFSDKEPEFTVKISFPLEPKTMDCDKPIYTGPDNCIFCDHPNHTINGKKIVGELEYINREGIYRIYKAKKI